MFKSGGEYSSEECLSKKGGKDYLCQMYTPVMSTEKEHLEALVLAMRQYFDNGKTLDLGLRKKLLLKLQETIEENQDTLCEAAYADFHKPRAEMLLTEIYPVLAEIKNTLRHMERWSKPERVATNLLMLPSSSRVHKSPQGLVMLFAPWNYSFWLSLMPLVSAVAAGNVVLLKPAHETPEISRMTQKIVTEVFPAEHVSVVLGEGAAVGEILLEHFEFDHIFFTGSNRVGRWIMEKAAKHLSKVTLELGGKSPSIIDDHFDLEKAARKIIWGKVINAGQTCVSTDYVLLPKKRVAEFTEACKRQILSLIGDQPFVSEEYCHIINEQRFDRLITLLEGCEILHGGRFQKDIRCIEPTLVNVKDFNLPIMKEEIFGPILPILAYENKEHLLTIIRKNRYPLSLYMFVEDQNLKQFILDRVEFGSGCFNNTIYQLGNPNLPFGGVRTSGTGSYHGKAGFNTFSNVKSMLHSPKWFDLPLLYQPYTAAKLKVIKWFFMH